MNAEASPSHILLARLDELAQQQSALPGLCVRALQAHHIKAVDITGPVREDPQGYAWVPVEFGPIRKDR